MVGELRGPGSFDPSYQFMRRDRGPVEPSLDNAEEKRRRALRAGADMGKEMPGVEGAAGEKVKEKGENPYLRVQIREAVMRKELGKTMDEAAVEQTMVKIRGAESDRLINMSKEDARQLAAQYAGLTQEPSDIGMAAK